MSTLRKGKRLTSSIAACLLLLACALPGAVFAGSYEEQRIDIGLKLFIATVAADLDIRDKTTADGRLRLLLIHEDTPWRAQHCKERLAGRGEIAGLPIEVETLGIDQLSAIKRSPIAAIFACQRLDEKLAQLSPFAAAQRALLFSPFTGDVEHGAHAGIAITDRILPFINPSALRGAGIRLKPFFTEVAVEYE